MSLYQQNIVSGQETTWKRAVQIIIDNPLGGVPRVTYIEEIAISLPDGTTVVKPSTQCVQVVDDMSANLVVKNIATGEVITTIPAGFLYSALGSSYLETAAARDAADAAAIAARDNP